MGRGEQEEEVSRAGGGQEGEAGRSRPLVSGQQEVAWVSGTVPGSPELPPAEGARWGGEPFPSHLLPLG